MYCLKHWTKYLFKIMSDNMTLEKQKEIIQKRHELWGLAKWNKEDCGNRSHRNKVFYKTDGLLPYETRKGLLYETPNWELISELLRRSCSGEIDEEKEARYLKEWIDNKKEYLLKLREWEVKIPQFEEKEY